MAVMRHSIIFGGIDSADFGIYIGGEGTFNAPERDVEMISIPGRDGAFALDKGRFENIEVKYTVINQEPDLATFSANLEGFRNALCSQRGYQRLEDTFHPDEYRMAVFADKFEAKPIEYNTASKFDIVFNCKPQRYLTDGETAVSVEDGDTLTNPTLFEAHPLLMVEGAGAITLNGYGINIEDEEVGEIELVPAVRDVVSYGGDYRENMVLLENGDDMVLDNFKLELTVKLSSYSGNPYKKIRNVNFSRTASNLPNYIGVDTTKVSDAEVRKIIKYGPQTFTKQSTAVETVDSCKLEIGLEDAGGTATTYNYTFDILVKLQGAGTSQGKGHLIIQRTNPSSTPSNYYSVRPSISASAFVGISTQSVLGNPTYIDCDLGEAYKIIDGRMFQLNRYIDLGSKLPELSPGDNGIEVDGGITSLEIVPHWWKV
jgi:phage-related protein